MMKIAAAALSCALLGLSMASAEARPLTPAEQRVDAYSGVLPFCDDPSVLGKIQGRFASRENSYWDSGLAIVQFDRVRETGYRKTGVDYIPRRYCSARAATNDGKLREVVYHVDEKLGFISLGWGVEWCVNGLDRNYAFGANCRAARP